MCEILQLIMSSVKIYSNIIFAILVYLVVVYFLLTIIPYKTAKHHYLIVATITIFVVVIYLIENGAHFLEFKSWIAIADNIFSGALFSILCIFMWTLEKKIKNRSEDREKLTQNYEKLSEKYKKDDLIIAKNVDGTEIIYPVICVGTGMVSIKDEKTIKICDSPDKFYEKPPMAENNFVAIFSIHDTSNIYNSINIRVTNMSFINNEIYFQTERTTYYDSLVTNRAADFKIAEGVSLRQIYECGPCISKLSESRFSNHLGFNGFLESMDGYIVFVKRSKDLSTAKNTYGDSIGASLKSKYALDDDLRFTQTGLVKALFGEINDELSITENEIEGTPLIIALYRDCVECGKPQFLFYAKSTRNAEDITKNFMDGNKDNTKKLSRRDGSKLVWLYKDNLKYVIFEYGGIRLKKDGFISFEHGKRKIQTTRLNMVPSASASLWLLMESCIYKKDGTNKSD